MRTHPLLLGHRGARGAKTPAENTLAAFDYALAQGCDGFEFDVRMTADGQSVIFHDATLSKKRRGCKIAETTSENLNLPTLHEVLARYQSRAFLDIELKVGGLEKGVVEMLREIPPTRGFVVSSFLPEVLERLRDLNRNILLGLICETQAELRHWSELPVDYVIPHYKLVRQDLIAELKGAGKKSLVWTVNLAAQMKRFRDWGVDGIISDSPAKLVRAFAE